ncbi:MULTISPECIES: alpha/beta hydrolase [unclassified Caballeronia]|uniref:alpha/beta fold hydrolase n=1 Tax=unclassified Caballeronia TaxID=2646786 RepID=UPI00285B496B|nr:MULTISPECIES: alpha/beta hydrolase [unclassified Caballeronia]MDR5752390.1 alpha/beta hydrolase [Caballeronia sp. LZ024]MDR5845195.1 alpha/beta hydrolase [Caballeronia sp. LZ031]
MSAGSLLVGAPQPMHIWKTPSGIGLAADTWGSPDRPLVILLHGGGQTRHAWGETGVRLGNAGYFAVAYDARGHGDSTWSPDGDYGLEVLAQDLRCVIDAANGAQPVLVGASLGGATSLVAIGEQRVEAAALILVDFVPYTEPAGVDRIRKFMRQKPEGFDSLEAVAEAISEYRRTRSRRRDLDGLAKNVRIGNDGRYHWHWDPRFIAQPVDLRGRHERLCACARRLSAPTLLVRGASSDVVSDKGVREFLELCPHADYINVAEAGHMVAGDRNDRFGRVAIDFLQRKVPLPDL